MFAAWAGLAGGGAEPRGVIRLTAAEVDWLETMWARQWQRPPDDQELRALVTDHLREELLANEARALGLAEGDTVVRRRLAQKMEFIVQDTAAASEPAEEELQRLYEANRARFEAPARISFVQVPFQRDGGDDAARALVALSTADAPADPARLGDPSLLAREIAGEDAKVVAAIFGPGFTKAVFALEPGRWQGPIESAYGLHLVRVTEKQPARPRTFSEVREELLEEWRRRRQEAEKEKYLASLLRKYDVVVDERVKALLGPLSVARAEEGAR